MIFNMCFISKIEPNNMKEALNDELWVTAMQEELIQFEINRVWEIVPRPNSAYALTLNGFTRTILMKWICYYK